MSATSPAQFSWHLCLGRACRGRQRAHAGRSPAWCGRARRSRARMWRPIRGSMPLRWWRRPCEARARAAESQPPCRPWSRRLPSPWRTASSAACSTRAFADTGRL